MKRASSVAVMALFSGWVLASAHPIPQSSAEPSQKQPVKAGAPVAGASLTGCVDQLAGRFVIVDDSTLQPIASLEADGFATEAFAKHVGHKVTVRGTSIPGGEKPTFKVRKIEPVSDTCEPKKQLK